MAGSGSPQPKQPKPPAAAAAPRKPQLVMHISKKEEQDRLRRAQPNNEPWSSSRRPRRPV